MDVTWFLLAYRRGKPFSYHNLYGSPPGRFFCPCKRNQNRAKGNRAFPFANPFDAWLRWIRILFFCGSRKTNPYCAQMRSKGSLRRHFYRPRAGARRANHHPSPLLKGGELWCGWANTLRSAASFLGKYISRTPTTAKLIYFYYFLNLKTFCKILCEFNTFTANFPVFVRISGRCFSFFRFPFLRARGKTPNFSKGAKRAWKKSIFPR